MNEVARKTPPKTNNTVPNTPETAPVKYKTKNKTAAEMRTILSVFPMFFFIITVLKSLCSLLMSFH
jgi:hypothetical protein